jgi:hypothetical protein
MMSLRWLAEWLETTAGSIALRESIYMYPLVESIHVWGLALFVGMIAIVDLRLTGAALRRVPTSEVARRLLPWTAGAFCVMLLSGLMLFYAIPVRTYHSVWFRAKLILLVLSGLNAWVFHANVWRRVAEWDLDPVPPRGARVSGALSLLLWASIIFSGRMIAYNWFDCDQQPQSAFINWAAGCTTEAN